MTIEILGVLGRGLVDPDTAVVRADDAGLTRGDGCFEGLRIHRRGDGPAELDDLEAHLDRMARSAEGLAIPFDRAGWVELAEVVRAGWEERTPDGGEASAKFVLTRGSEAGVPTGFVTVSPLAPDTLEARRNGIDVVLMTRGVSADGFDAAPWLLGGIKTLSYAINMAAQREAQRRGADDALFVSLEGHLLEAPTSSVVWVKGGTVCTVAVGSNGILASIVTRRLMDAATAAGMPTAWTTATPQDLVAADVVLLVASVRGPVRIRRLDGVELVDGPGAAEMVSMMQEWTGFGSAGA